MIKMVGLLVLVCLFSLASSDCPHEEASLKKWSEDDTWGTSGKPAAGDNVDITEGILLDESPPDLYNITIASTGRLVFDPDTELNLRVANIYVHGALEIGSEACLYTGRLTITLTGTRAEHAGEKESKVILINAGGTLEIHGQHKRPWTKLTETVISNDDIYFEHTRNATYENLNSNLNGIAAYTFELVDNLPVVKEFGMYDIVNSGDILARQIDDVADGEILMMAVQKRIRNPGSAKHPPKVYDAFERLLYGNVTGDSILRSVDDQGTTWAFVYQKGNPASYAEDKQPAGHNAVARFRSDHGLVYSAETYGYMGSNNRQTDNFRVGTLDDIFPKLKLLDDVTTWLPGERIALASTDFDYEQAEEANIVLCTDCQPNEVRIDALLKYQHFGEMLGGAVDMRGEVAMLSRDIVIQGEMQDECPDGNGNCGVNLVFDTDTFGAHIKVLKNYQNVRIQNVELRQVGQQTDLGRYPVHFHMCFDKIESAAVPYLKGSSIHHTFARCVTVHGSNGVLVQDNACYEHSGHGYFLEDGGEMDNVFDGNLAMSANKASGKLEPTDKGRPTGFWMTNPRTYFTNNVAAGGHGTGIWFLYPPEPLSPTREFKVMEEYEARRTPMRAFYNNVAHSNHHTGVHIGGELKDNRAFHCCNRWQPREDPKNETSTPLVIQLDRITGYKNRFNNMWLEGGLLNATHLSSADSLNGILLSNDGIEGLFGCRSSHAAVIGESPNKGVPTEGFDRSLPEHWDTGAVQSGIAMWKGPTRFSHMWFDSFQSNPHYDIAALAKKRNSPYFFPIVNSFEDIQFAFDDAAGAGTYAITGDPEDVGWEKSIDGELISGFTLLQELRGDSRRFYIVKPDPFSAAAADCVLRPNWRFAISETRYGNLRMVNTISDSPIVFVRDDVPSAQLEFRMKSKTGPQVVLDGSRSYTIHFLQEITDGWFKIEVPGLEAGDSLRIGVCVPIGTKLDFDTKHPYALPKISKFTQVFSLEELDKFDAELDGKKYYHDNTTGMLYYKFINTVTRGTDDSTSCKNGDCPTLRVRVDGGDYLDADCRRRIYTDEQLSMPLPILPEFTDLIEANGGPTAPQGYGAGSTKPFPERALVDGGFSDWSDWSQCSRTCAGGEQYRARQCNQPMPENGGASCDGNAVETRACNENAC